MICYIIKTCEYWQNYRGQLGSISGIQGAYECAENALKELTKLRAEYMKTGRYIDISDEPGRYFSLQNRNDHSPFLDAQIIPMKMR